MSLTPSDLRAAADELRRSASFVVLAFDDVGPRSDGNTWRGPAADTFREGLRWADRWVWTWPTASGAWPSAWKLGPTSSRPRPTRRPEPPNESRRSSAGARRTSGHAERQGCRPARGSGWVPQEARAGRPARRCRGGRGGSGPMVGEPGLVALDPLGLARLEATLHGVAEAYRSCAGRIDDALWATGETAEGELVALRRLVDWCERHRDAIAHRRRVLDELPVALPLPAWSFATRAEAEHVAGGLASRLGAALERHPPSWTALSRLLAEVERGRHDEAFAAHLLTVLGPRRTALLPHRIDQAARADGHATGATVDEAQGALAAVVLTASRATGAGRLSEGWGRHFAGLDGPSGGVGDPQPDPVVRRRLEALGFGADLARSVALGLEAGTVATVVGGTGVVLAVAATAVGDEEADGWDLAGDAVGAAGSLGVFLVSSGVVTVPLVVAALLAGGVVTSALAWSLHQVEEPPADGASPENRRRRHSRTFDPATGISRFPGGGTDRPHQDGAGGVLPPSMTR